MVRHRHDAQPHQQHEPIVLTPWRYQVRGRLIASGDDYAIKVEQGTAGPFHIDGKVVRLRHTLLFEGSQGHEVDKIRGHLLHLHETRAIERGEQRVDEVHKAAVAPVGERLEVDVAGGQHLTVQGNLLDHACEITSDGRLSIAFVSKRWFGLRDSDGVEVAPAPRMTL